MLLVLLLYCIAAVAGVAGFQMVLSPGEGLPSMVFEGEEVHNVTIPVIFMALKYCRAFQQEASNGEGLSTDCIKLVRHELMVARYPHMEFSCDDHSSVCSTAYANMNIEDIVETYSSSFDTSFCFRDVHMEHEFAATNNEPLFQHAVNKGAIVILAQAGEHSTYKGRQSIRELMETLRLLYLNYNDQFKDDIWIFHEGDFSHTLQGEVRAGRSEIRFFRLEGRNWEVYPSDVQPFKKKDGAIAFSMGYRKMIRFYAIRIWHVLDMLGYTWVWRLDDDSHVLSPIRYNMFAFMEHFNYQYAYRNIGLDTPGYTFWDFVRSLILSRPVAADNMERLTQTCVNKSANAYDFVNCGLLPGYYNNFFVTNVSRWLEPDVQSVLSEFDDSGMIFFERWGDMDIQSTVVRLLFPTQSIHRFSGWSYAHFSGQPNNPGVGIIQAGVSEVNTSGIITEYAAHRGWRNGQCTADKIAVLDNKYLTFSTEGLYCTSKKHDYCFC